MKNSRRKKRSFLPISFFSFQDIITALAGSMLVIVLLTAVIRVHNASQKSSAPPSGDFDHYTQLQMRIKLTRSELADQQQKLSDLKKRLLQQRNSEHLRSENQRLKQELDKLEKTEQDYRRQEQKLSAALARLKQKNSARDAAAKEIADLLRKRTELEKQLADRLYRLKLQQVDGKKNVLLDCSRTAWLWSDEKISGELLNSSDITPESALKNLQNKLRQRNLLQTRLVIAVRPSAGGFFQALKRSLQKEFPALEITAEPMAGEDTGGLIL